jgi:hypothetical protein
VLSVIGAFADEVMSPADPEANGAVPPALTRHIEVAMRHIVQGIAAGEA